MTKQTVLYGYAGTLRGIANELKQEKDADKKQFFAEYLEATHNFVIELGLIGEAAPMWDYYSEQDFLTGKISQVLTEEASAAVRLYKQYRDDFYTFVETRNLPVKNYENGNDYSDISEEDLGVNLG